MTRRVRKSSERRQKVKGGFAYLQTTMVTGRKGNEDPTLLVSDRDLFDDKRRAPHYQKMQQTLGHAKQRAKKKVATAKKVEAIQIHKNAAAKVAKNKRPTLRYKQAAK